MFDSPQLHTSMYTDLRQAMHGIATQYRDRKVVRKSLHLWVVQERGVLFKRVKEVRLGKAAVTHWKQQLELVKARQGERLETRRSSGHAADNLLTLQSKEPSFSTNSNITCSTTNSHAGDLGLGSSGSRRSKQSCITSRPR